MPIAILLFVGLIFFEAGDMQKDKLEAKKTTQVLTTKVLKSKPSIEEVKVEPKKPELVKEEIKAEPKEPELIKEAVDTNEPAKNYLNLILYIIAGILAIFTGMYFFSSRGGGQSVGSKVDNSRVDIEENFVSEIQEQQPTEEETAQPETQEQRPTEEETAQPETQEQQPTEEDENNNK